VHAIIPKAQGSSRRNIVDIRHHAAGPEKGGRGEYGAYSRAKKLLRQ
jgi:hypothetical protein